MKKTFYDIVSLIKTSASRFNENDPIMLAGALAFFTVFAIPPILIIIIYGIGIFTGSSVATREVFNQIQSFLGKDGADLLKNIVKHYIVADQNILQRILSIGIFLFASSSFFLIIQHALNKIWSVHPKPENDILKIIQNRALSFGIIILMGFILMISLVSQSLLFSLRDTLVNLSPLLTPVVINIFSILFSLVIGTLILGAIYKLLPDVIIEWKVVWVGAAITSFLFLLGKFIIGFALQTSSVQQMYGTAGSTAIFLLWVFYCSIILFYGAKVTQQYALAHAETIKPKKHAVKIETHEVDKGDENKSDHLSD